MRALRVILAVSAVLCLAAAGLAWHTLSYDYGNDRFMTSRGTQLGFAEKTYQTPDGRTIAYLEGPDAGEPLLLIHGQMVSKEDYAKVLPELSRRYHVFAVDCYGHGGSSKDPNAYNITTIRDDLVGFMGNVIRARTLVAGHSSGALIAAAVAAAAPGQVSGLLLEDGPFFSTEPGRAQNTLSYKEFRTIHDFLTQDEETNYTRYYLSHTYMSTLFDSGDGDTWEPLVKRPFSERIDEGGGVMPIVWYYPPEVGLNSLVFLTRNLQDGTGTYDLRFGDAFYDFSWFAGFDQEQALRQIACPTLILHVAPSSATAPSYYDRQGVLISAMDESDARRVHALIARSELIEGYASRHDIHDELPREYVDAVDRLSDGVTER
ncbi:alpha/beta fold hydrolase [Olsenella massiliensis]|uniref:alpha/beta fold hydrolase n=1 Tax=Olsenella massiliensis TaxID=1622075 RepID=UPI00071CC554|nr:alpha/beta hydrolase [Olsenella massiliensis]